MTLWRYLKVGDLIICPDDQTISESVQHVSRTGGVVTIATSRFHSHEGYASASVPSENPEPPRPVPSQRDIRNARGRTRSVSVRAVSGGLPTLGKRHR